MSKNNNNKTQNQLICDDDTIKFTKEDVTALNCILLCKCTDYPNLFDIILNNSLVNNDKYSYEKYIDSHYFIAK
jgi:hypothetical protein